MEELSKILLTDDMTEQNMTDKILDTLKELGYGFYYPAYGGGHAVDIAVIKESTAYLFEVKRKGASRHVVSTLIMQGIGQLLKYYYLIEDKVINKAFPTEGTRIGRIIRDKNQARDVKIKAFLIYCGFVSEKDECIVKRSIERFNLPVELIIIPTSVDFILTPVKNKGGE